MLNLMGKALVQDALPGETSRRIQGNRLSIVSQRLSYADINANVSFLCNSSSFNESVVDPVYCNAFRFRLFANSTPIFSHYNRTESMEKLAGSRFGSNNTIDLVSVLSFINVGNKMSPTLSVALSNLSSTCEVPMNLTVPFVELHFPVYSQRTDQSQIPNENLTCKYLDTTKAKWLEDGCVRTDNGSTEDVTCQCSHLTLFVLDVTAAKGAISGSNAYIILNTTEILIDPEEMTKSFSFWLILLLILLMLISLLVLHCIDIKNKHEGMFYTQKLEALGTFFPNPKDKFIDFFANGPFPKEDLMDLIKIGLGLMPPPPKEDPMSSSKSRVFHTASPANNNKEEPSSRSPSGSPIMRPSSPGSSSSVAGKIDQEKSLRHEDSKENPEEQHSRQELALQTGSQLSQGSSRGSPNSPKTSPNLPSRPRLRGSMLATLYNSASFAKEIGSATQTKLPTTPVPFTEGTTSSSLKIRLYVPQYAPCSFFVTLVVALKVFLFIFSPRETL